VAVLCFDGDESGPRRRLPRLTAPCTALAFHPSQELLVATSADNRFRLFDVAAGDTADWSREYGDRLPEKLTGRDDAVVGACFFPDDADGASSSRLVLRGQTFLCFVDLDAAPGAGTPPTSTGKRAREDVDADERNFVVVTRYKPLLHAGFVAGSPAESAEDEAAAGKSAGVPVKVPELAAVQMPWVDVLGQLPEPLYRKRYGT
jgi:hypothetical protein